MEGSFRFSRERERGRVGGEKKEELEEQE